MKRTLCLAVLMMAVIGPALADECDIDQALRDKRVAMNRHAKEKIDQGSKAAMDGAPSVKDGACVAVLDQLDGLIRARIPTIGGIDGILSGVRDMACEVANDTVSTIAKRAEANIGDPYGIVSVGVGTTSGEGGMQTDTYDMTKVLGDAAIKAAGQAASSTAGAAARDAVSTIPETVRDRNPRSVESTANDVSRGAVNEAVNGL